MREVVHLASSVLAIGPQNITKRQTAGTDYFSCKQSPFFTLALQRYYVLNTRTV